MNWIISSASAVALVVGTFLSAFAQSKNPSGKSQSAAVARQDTPCDELTNDVIVRLFGKTIRLYAVWQGFNIHGPRKGNPDVLIFECTNLACEASAQVCFLRLNFKRPRFHCGALTKTGPFGKCSAL